MANAPVCAAISAALRIIDGIRPGVMPSGLDISSTSAPIARIVRTFSVAIGLAASIFTQTSAQPSSAMRASRTTGVLPIAESPPVRSIPTSNAKGAGPSLW